MTNRNFAAMLFRFIRSDQRMVNAIRQDLIANEDGMDSHSVEFAMTEIEFLTKSITENRAKLRTLSW